MTVTAPIVVALVLALLVGVTIGLFGGGGGILTLPILTYAAGFPTEQAIAMSLFIVGTTSLISAVRHAFSHRVQWKIGTVFALGSMVGSFFGGKLSGYLPGTVLMLIFGTVMFAAGIGMIRRRRGDTVERRPKVWLVVVLGTMIGVIAGLVGAGGGFLIVPALALVGGLGMNFAVATSVYIIALQSAAGLLGHLGQTEIPWVFTLVFTGLSIMGSMIGASFIGKVPERKLKRGFGVFVLAMAVFVLGEQILSAV